MLTLMIYTIKIICTMMRICTMLRTVVHTTWPFDSNGSSFNFFSMIGVGEVGRLLFATIGSWSGGIGSVGNWTLRF